MTHGVPKRIEEGLWEYLLGKFDEAVVSQGDDG